jgi:cytochrome b6-f complex iron-sulfur subunit
VSATTIALVVVGVSVAVWALVMANVAFRRRRAALATSAGTAAERGPAGAPEVAPGGGAPSRGSGEPDVTVQRVPEKQRKPLTPEQMAVSRRQFLNRAGTATFSAFLGFFGMATLSFLWPKLTGGFGTEINAGNYDELLAQVGPDGGYRPLFVPEGRFWLTYYDGSGDSPVYAATGATEAKMQALYRKCVHLGCSVPHCETSMLFECPCHGSKYRLSGEFYGGPAPRGLDRFPITVSGGNVLVDTGSVQTGPPRGTDTWPQFSQPQGPLCVPV